MRLTITFFLLLSIAGTILYLTESKETEQIERFEVAREAKEESIKQQRDSIIQAILNSPNIDSVDLSGFELTELPYNFIRFEI